MKHQDSEQRPLEPGALYAKCWFAGSSQDVRYGSLVRYGSDGKFYNSDDDDSFDEDNSRYDFVVRQNCPINSEYVF